MSVLSEFSDGESSFRTVPCSLRPQPLEMNIRLSSKKKYCLYRRETTAHVCLASEKQAACVCLDNSGIMQEDFVALPRSHSSQSASTAASRSSSRSGKRSRHSSSVSLIRMNSMDSGTLTSYNIPR